MTWWILQSTLMAGAMAAIIGLACRLRRLTPAFQHVLWLVVLVKLLTPPVLVWPWRLPDVAALVGSRSPPGAPGPEAPVPPIRTVEFTACEAPALEARAPGAAAPNAIDSLTAPPGESVAEVETVEARGMDARSREGAGGDAGIIEGGAVARPPFEVMEGVARGADSLPGANAPPEPDAPLELASAPARASPASAARGARRELESVVGDLRRSIAPLFTSWAPILLAAWVCGSMAVFAVEALRLRGLARLVARARPAPRGLSTIVQETASGIGIRAPPALVAEGLSSPILACLGRPKLIFPTALLDRLGYDGCRSAAAHELAHFRRRDHWVGWLELAGEILLWWNPLYWFVRRRLRESAELACDAWVVWALPGSRRAYAEALIEVCRLKFEGGEPLPALGMGSGPRTVFFQRRLSMILLDRVRCKTSLAGLLCAGLLALAFLPAWAQESSSAVQAPPTSTSPAAGLQLAPQVPPPPQPAPVAPPALPAPPAGMNVPPPAVSSSGEEPAAIEPGASAFEGEAPEAAPAAVPLPSANTRRVQATSRTGSRRAVNAAAPGAYEATDERFAKLEAQFQQLAAEMAFLRAQLARMGRKPMDLSTASPFEVSSTERKTADAQMYPPPQAGVATNDGNWNAPRAPVSAQELNAGASLQVGGRTETALVRTIYKLPGAKAEALASFLAENVELDLEVTAGEDGLIVTADREASEAIARLISLMTRRKPAPDSRPAARP